MPVKAKAPQYVKICTLYGDGYYYIPGTDTCIKLGGYIRLDVVWNADGGRTPDYAGATGAQDRSVGELTSRARANMAADTRTSTQYGVVRTLASVHFQNQDQADSLNVARAFVQWQGFTFGRMKSYQDTFNIGDNYNIETQQTGSDTGANGVNSIAYTQDLGNGVTLTGAVDERRIKSLTNLSVASALKVGAEPTTFYQGAVGQQTWPDPYLALHIDQSWGNFAVSRRAPRRQCELLLCQRQCRWPLRGVPFLRPDPGEHHGLRSSERQGRLLRGARRGAEDPVWSGRQDRCRLPL